MNTFGEILKKLRKEKGLSGQELASILKVHKGSISNWETNRRSPDKEMLNTIAEYFDVSIDYLLGRTNERNLHKEEEKTSSEGIDLDKKDIEEIIDELLQVDGLMLCGEPISEHDLVLLRNSIRNTLEWAKSSKNKK